MPETPCVDYNFENFIENYNKKVLFVKSLVLDGEEMKYFYNDG